MLAVHPRLRPLGRQLWRVAHRAYVGRSSVPDEPIFNWPLVGAGVLGISLLGAGALGRSDWLLRRVQSYVESPGTALGAEGASVFQIGGLMAAFTLAQLPVDDLKIRLLDSGAARSWGRLVASFEADIQQVALGALTAMLEGPVPMQAFHGSDEYYHAYLDALPPVLHASPTATPLNDSEVLLDALRLTAALSNHPAFEHAEGDGWFYERMLEQAAPATDFDHLAALYWACTAAAASRRRDVAQAMLASPIIKRYLVQLAPSAEEPDEAGTLDALGGLPDEADWPPLGKLRSSGSMPPSCGEVDAVNENGGAEAGVNGRHVGGMMRRGNLDLGQLRRATGDTTIDTREHLIEEYAHLALSRLAAHAAEEAEEREERVRRGIEDPSSAEEVAARHEPFLETHAAPPDPEPPALPPLGVSDLASDERLLEGILSVAFCTLGGLAWGALRGFMPSSRAHRTVLSAVGSTAAGAALFETAMLIKMSLRERLPFSLGGGHGNYTTPVRLADATAIDVLVSAEVLWLLMRQIRSPFLFGGWLLGRSAILLSDLIDVELEFME